MNRLSSVLVGFVALQHVAFMVLEMFFWTKPIGLKIFKQTAEAAEASKVLAANQGLYNGFLAAGLVWALLASPVNQQQNIAMFFLSCVVVAGVFGGATAKPTIFFIQALPALIALIVVYMGKSAAAQ